MVIKITNRWYWIKMAKTLVFTMASQYSRQVILGMKKRKNIVKWVGHIYMERVFHDIGGSHC